MTMAENDNQEMNDQNKPPEEVTEFIQEFIERKKLQNRVLQELLDKINRAEQSNQVQPTDKPEKS
jgi:hypothetical protein